MHKQRDRSCFLSFSFLFFPPFLSALQYLVRFAWSTLPLSRANICRYTLKRSEARRRRDTLAKFGISTNLSSTNIRLLVCRERLCSPRFSPPPLLRVLSATFTTSSRRIFASLISVFPCRYHLVKRLLTEGNSNEVDPLYES